MQYKVGDFMDSGGEHKYARLLSGLREAIVSGKYANGARLETEISMAERFSVSRQTVRRAIGVLESEGYVVRRQGSGTYVRFRGDDSAPLTRTVGVVTTYISEYILPSFIRGIEEVTEKNGYSFILRSTGNRVDREREVLEFLLESRVDGLIIEGAKTAFPNPNLDVFRRFEKRGIPVVFMNGYYTALGGVYVVTDDRAGGKIAMEHLIEKGHRKIGGIFKADDVQGHERYAGFIEAAREADVGISDSNIQWYTTEQREKITENADFLLEGIEDCTAVVCYNDQIAAPLESALIRAGRKIPEDIAVISFDNSVYAQIAPVPITSLDHPKEEVGRVAAGKVLSMIKGKRETSTALPWGLAIRQST